MKIRKFNERIESGHATYEYIHGAAEFKNYEDGFEGDLYPNGEGGAEFVFRDSEVRQIPNWGYYIEKFNRGVVYLFQNDSETPKAILEIYELHGTSIFENMFIMHGHENILLYNLETGSYKNIHTR